MANDQDRYSRALFFVLHNGTEVFPVRMKNRSTGQIAYRVSPGGTGGNTLEVSEEVDEETMINKVLNFDFAVRCASLNGSVRGLYKKGQRSVREVRREINLSI